MCRTFLFQRLCTHLLPCRRSWVRVPSAAASKVLLTSRSRAFQLRAAGASAANARPLEPATQAGTNTRSARNGSCGRGMTPPNKRTVTPPPDGWSVEKPMAARASSVHGTQQQAIDAARRTLANSGGGELAIKGRNGQVRAQDTIPPGNDPRRSRG
jgi:hypothetical protein